MCPLRRRAQALFNRHANPSYTRVPTKTGLDPRSNAQDQKSSRPIQFDSFIFKLKQKCSFFNISHSWELYQLKLIPFYQFWINACTPPQDSFPQEKPQIHSIQLEDELCELWEMQTTVSLKAQTEVESSTLGRSAWEEILSMSRSVISVEMEI